MLRASRYSSWICQTGKSTLLSVFGYITVNRGLEASGRAKYMVELYKKNASQTASRARSPAVSIKRTNEPLVSVPPFPTHRQNCICLDRIRPHRSQSPTSIITAVIQWLLISLYVCVCGITMRETYIEM